MKHLATRPGAHPAALAARVGTGGALPPHGLQRTGALMRPPRSGVGDPCRPRNQLTSAKTSVKNQLKSARTS